MAFASGRHFLQIPGPTNVPDRVLRAIDRPTIDHRGPEFAQLAPPGVQFYTTRVSLGRGRLEDLRRLAHAAEEGARLLADVDAIRTRPPFVCDARLSLLRRERCDEFFENADHFAAGSNIGSSRSSARVSDTF